MTDAPPDLDDAMAELEDLEELVDSPEERDQVREAMATLEQARPRPFGRLRDAFDLRDAGEALVGSFLFGIPMVVEGGTQEIGVVIAQDPLRIGFTALLGLALVFGILRAVEYEKVSGDRFFGVIPIRPMGILSIAFGLSLVLMTAWGRVDWARPVVAASQILVTGIVMAVGASLGDILPGT
ncbi:MAG: hypothetical protein ABEH64_10770 [Salinirussus sp.]